MSALWRTASPQLPTAAQAASTVGRKKVKQPKGSETQSGEGLGAADSSFLLKPTLEARGMAPAAGFASYGSPPIQLLTPGAALAVAGVWRANWRMRALFRLSVCAFLSCYVFLSLHANKNSKNAAIAQSPSSRGNPASSQRGRDIPRTSIWGVGWN